MDGAPAPLRDRQPAQGARAGEVPLPSSRGRSPRIGTTVFLFGMNKKRYESLPADLKKVIDANSRRNIAEMAGQNWDDIEKPGKDATKKAGNNFPVMPVAEVERSPGGGQARDRQVPERPVGRPASTPPRCTRKRRRWSRSTRSSCADSLTRVLDGLARAFAFGGGAVLVALTGMSVASIAGRTLLGTSGAGRLRARAVGRRRAIALFMPCASCGAATSSSTSSPPGRAPRTQRRLDRFGALLLALVDGAAGLAHHARRLNAWKSQSGTMHDLGFPSGSSTRRWCRRWCWPR